MTQLQVNEATRQSSGDVCRDLIASGAIEESRLLRFLGLHHQTRYVSTDKLSSAKVLQWVLDLLSLEFCEKHQVLPIRCDKQTSTLSIVTTDPSDTAVMDQIKGQASVKEVLAYVALPHAIEAGVRKLYRGDLHAFARMDQSLRQNYSEMMNIYEQRLIDFESDDEDPDELVLETNGSASSQEIPTNPVDPRKYAVTEQVSPLSSPAPRDPGTAGIAPGLVGSSPMVQLVEILIQQLEQGMGWRAGHSTQVARVAAQLAGKAGLAPDTTADLMLVALLHELGKPAEPHVTLLGLDTDTPLRARASELRQAPTRQLHQVQLPGGVREALDSLYERFDGKGIPGQLSGDKLPLVARLLQVADAHCELTSNPRAAGGQCDGATAIKRLELTGGFDPALVKHLTATKGGATRTGRLVLIVDEDPHSAALLEGQLKTAGFDAVVATTTGDAALVLLGEEVTLVLSEVDLKPMDGFTFLHWLRTNQRTSNIPFMFVSRRAGADDVNRGFELGAIDYIVKPFRPEVVLAKIKRNIAL